MYVIWRSGLQPGRPLHITHILFRCGAMEGGTPACVFSFLEINILYERKNAPDVLSLTKIISPMKVLCSGACGSAPAVFFENYGV